MSNAIRSGSNPFKNIAEDFQIPYGVVVCYAEYIRRIRRSAIGHDAFKEMHEDYAMGNSQTMKVLVGYWSHWAYEQVGHFLPDLSRRREFENAIAAKLIA